MVASSPEPQTSREQRQQAEEVLLWAQRQVRLLQTDATDEECTRRAQILLQIILSSEAIDGLQSLRTCWRSPPCRNPSPSGPPVFGPK